MPTPMDTDRYGQYASVPIPTYDEAVTDRPASSDDRFRGPQEVSDDAERQNLLDRSSYQPPTVESGRSSVETDLGLPEMEVTGAMGTEARRHIEEMDYLDPMDDVHSGAYQQSARIRRNLSKRLANLSATFSSLRLPSLRSLYTSVPLRDDLPSSSPTQQASRRWQWPLRTVSLPHQYRLSAPTIARLFGLFAIATMVYVLFALDIFPGRNRRFGMRFDPEAVRSFVHQTASGGSIANYLRYISSYDHVAGTEGDLFLARWMHEQWEEYGGFDQLATLEYYVYLNYPKPGGRSVTITQPNDLRWTAMLEEDLVSPTQKQTLVWHGHSKSGVATGPLVYANGGSREDFAWLAEQGIVLNGSIALVRYYATQGDRALKVKAAEDAGCAGVLIYSDPSDDGSLKGEVWPFGRWRPADSVQRGTVSLMSWVVGDPLTPGWPSTKGAHRIKKEKSLALVQIPSLPLSWRDAKVLIAALQGHGVAVPDNWVGGTDGGQWFSGTGARQLQSEALPEVELKNINDENDKQRIWNVHGLIQGSEQGEKKIIIGNHRDAWCFGAADPGSGSAVMMEVIGILGSLTKIGWRPLRTIEFVSWDAEEYNLIGSTEYVEDKIDYLRQHGVAYLNVDTGVTGSKFRASGAPLLRKALMGVLDRVSDPSGNGTLRELWQQSGSKLEGLGAGSDYVAFQDIAGTSSLDFSFVGPQHGFPYHSCYETFEWVQTFGDPEFHYHQTLAQVWALLILDLADRPLIPLDLNDYMAAIKTYITQLQRDAEQTVALRHDLENVTPESLKGTTGGFDLRPLRRAMRKVTQQVERFHRFEEIWSTNVLGSGGLESMNYAFSRLKYNERVAAFDSDLLDLPYDDFPSTLADDQGSEQPNKQHRDAEHDDDEDKEGSDDRDHRHDHDHDHDRSSNHGIPGREQFKHILFGPQIWSGYDEAYFPAIRDAIAADDWVAAQAQVLKAARILERAGNRLVDGLSW